MSSEEESISGSQWKRLLSSPDTSSSPRFHETRLPKTALNIEAITPPGVHSDDIVFREKNNSRDFLQGEFKGDVDRCYSWLHMDRHANRLSREKRESESSEESNWSVGSLPLPPSPDGGWGWFVVLGAFVISFICDGLAFCFGVLYAELLEQFHESRSKTSLVGSIFFGVPMIMGPIASSLTTRFGCRKMTIFGGLLSSFGFILSYFANSIEMLCFTFSVVVGAGFSFCYITSVVIVAFYFEKRRALATGLAVCGTGVGTFSFAPFMDYLICEYGWRGLFLIMAGISLNLVVCGMLFRPLKFSHNERWEIMLREFNKLPSSREEMEMARNRYPSESSESESISEDTINEDGKALSVLNIPSFVSKSKMEPPSFVLLEALRCSRNPHHTMQRYMKNAMMNIDYFDVDPREEKTKLIDDCTFTITMSSVDPIDSVNEDTTDNLPSCLLDETEDNKSQENAIPTKSSYKGVSDDDRIPNKWRSVGTQIDLSSKHEEHSVKSSKTQETGAPSAEARNLKSQSKDRRATGLYLGRHSALGIHLPLYRSDIFYRRLSLHNESLKQCTLTTSCPEILASEESTRGYIASLGATFCGEIADILRSMVNVKLLCNPFFVIFSMSNFVYYFWSDVPYMYAADHAINSGVSQYKAAFILSIIGIFNTVGQVVFGYTGDLQINLLNVYSVVSMLAGFAVALVPLMSSYGAVCTVYAFFGFCVSVTLPLTTVLLVNYLGMEALTSAYGLLMLIQGIANLCGPPFAGWVSDITGSYNTAYYLSGFFYVVSGIVLMAVYIPGFKVRDYQSYRDAEMTVSSPDTPPPPDLV